MKLRRDRTYCKVKSLQMDPMVLSKKLIMSSNGYRHIIDSAPKSNKLRQAYVNILSEKILNETIRWKSRQLNYDLSTLQAHILVRETWLEIMLGLKPELTHTLNYTNAHQ